MQHIPVLLNESVAALNINPLGVYVDATFGRGGHSQAILQKLSHKGKLYGIDQDSEAIKIAQVFEREHPQFRLIEGNFVNISAFLAIANVDLVNGILFDLGTSSPQLDQPERGFSYQTNGPLDMRMDVINNSLTAAQVVNESSVEELTHIIKTYGEEVHASLIAEEIVKARPLKTTFELVAVIKKALPARILRAKGHPAKQTFQALRIHVNRELEVLKLALEQSLELLAPKGRLVVISFHSLEERIIKAIFRQATVDPYDTVAAKLPIMLAKKSNYRLVNLKPIRPKSEEVLVNRRAHSAKLWAIERI